jgi:hypothetical protein
MLKKVAGYGTGERVPIEVEFFEEDEIFPIGKSPIETTGLGFGIM